MRFTKVDSVPRVVRRHYNKLEAEFEEFLAMNVKTVKVVIGEHEYKSPKIAYSTLCKAAKHWGVPVKVVIRKDDIYFVRTDM